MIEINQKLNNNIIPKRIKWLDYCNDLKANNPIVTLDQKKNPIDLYYFMKLLGDLSNSE